MLSQNQLSDSLQQKNFFLFVYLCCQCVLVLVRYVVVVVVFVCTSLH